MSNLIKEFKQEDLNRVLWDAADSSRSAVDASVYKDYVLAMLFLKYLSDLSKKQHDIYRERFWNNESRIQEKMKSDRFYIPEKATFDYLYSINESDNIWAEINKALHLIEEENSEKLEWIFSSIDFNSESTLWRLEQRNKMIRHLIHDFYKIDLSYTNDDIIWNSYMYLIERFWSQAGKKAWEFFSPKHISLLLAKLAQPKEWDRICDPACWSWWLLLLAWAEIESKWSKNYALYGQESTWTTYQLARMNMFLHGKDHARIEWWDTLNNPMLVENDKLMKFDICVSNPPFSLAKWWAENAGSDKYKRFFRWIPPKDKWDYAFISHMIETVKPLSWRVAVIVPHWVLFRWWVEWKIRQSLVEENLIDAVIWLAPWLFQTTWIPVAILILDRSREKWWPNENKKDILFIEASKEFKPWKAQNSLSEENINKIIDTYINRKEIEKFSRKVWFDEINDNEFNLNITRYVDTFEEEEEIDISANIAELKKLEPELKELERQMEEHLRGLKIK